MFSESVVITGALSYTGKYVTQLLLSRGHQIRTLTNHPERKNPFGERVQVFPYSFHDPEQLRRTLRGASTLINTYWVRFPRGASNFETAGCPTLDLPPLVGAPSFHSLIVKGWDSTNPNSPVRI